MQACREFERLGQTGDSRRGGGSRRPGDWWGWHPASLCLSARRSIRGAVRPRAGADLCTMPQACHPAARRCRRAVRPAPSGAAPSRGRGGMVPHRHAFRARFRDRSRARCRNHQRLYRHDHLSRHRTRAADAVARPLAWLPVHAWPRLPLDAGQGDP